MAIMMGEDVLGDNNVETNVYSNEDFVSAKAMNVVCCVAMAMRAVEMAMTKAPCYYNHDKSTLADPRAPHVLLSWALSSLRVGRPFQPRAARSPAPLSGRRCDAAHGSPARAPPQPPLPAACASSGPGTPLTSVVEP
jgi:hypothetical protein